MQQHPSTEDGNPLVDMQTMTPTSRLNDPGIGLRDNGRRVLTYADLRSLFDDPDGREPGRTIELHLTGHMERFAWSFDGVRFADAEPLRLVYGERVRIVLVNDTMMTHPIHLHGMWSDLEDVAGVRIGRLLRRCGGSRGREQRPRQRGPLRREGPSRRAHERPPSSTRTSRNIPASM